ncbi:MAG: hypothetical protein LH480_01165 [Rubrivivax sp.]|nr:hypothetical protein [Rubrivivax sp.]
MPPQLARAAVPVSGLYHLEPLRRARFLAPDLNLTAACALQLSPAHLPSPQRGRLAAFVGADESAGFRRRAQLIRRAWGDAVVTTCETVPGDHHMSALHALAGPEARPHRVTLQLLG